MSAQQEAVALWKYLESRGLKPTMNSVGRSLRDHDLHFTNQELRGWLDKFAVRRRRKLGTASAQPKSMNGANAAQVRLEPGAPSHEKEVSLFSDLGSGLRPSPDVAAAPPAVGKPAKKPRQPRLPDPAELELKRKRAEIMRALWGLIGPHIDRSTTFTDWRDRNNKTGLSFVKLGFTPEKACSYWQTLSRLQGEPIRELSFLQKKLEEAQVKSAAERARDKQQAVQA